MAGHLDPRVLVSYFPDLRGGLFTAEDNVPMFGGVAEHMPPYTSVDDLSEYASCALRPFNGLRLGVHSTIIIKSPRT